MNTEDFLTGYEIGKQFREDHPTDSGFLLPEQKAARADKIMGICCGYFGLSTEAIIQKGGGLTLHARQITHYMLKVYSGLTLKEIGRRFGKDHSNIIHSSRRVYDRIKAKIPIVIRDVNSLTELIEEAIK